MENILCLSLQVHNSVTVASDLSQHVGIYLCTGRKHWLNCPTRTLQCRYSHRLHLGNQGTHSLNSVEGASQVSTTPIEPHAYETKRNQKMDRPGLKKTSG